MRHINDMLFKFINNDIKIYSLLIFLMFIGEIFAAFAYLYAGFFVFMFLFLSLLLTAVYKYPGTVHILYTALTFIPLIRIIQITIPLKGMPKASIYLAVSTPLFITGIIIARIVHLTFKEMGFCLNKLYCQFFIAFLGLPLGFIEFILINPGTETVASTGKILLWILIFIICTGFLEEFLFRGILYNIILKVTDDKKAIFYTSFLYVALSVNGKSFLYAIYAFSVSFIFCRIFAHIKSILGLSIAHGLINITFYIICPMIFTK